MTIRQLCDFVASPEFLNPIHHTMPNEFVNKPLPVPEKLSPEAAKNLFDEGETIYIVPARYRLTPKDIHDPQRVRRSYQYLNWNSWMEPTRAAKLAGGRLFEVWGAILEDARRQAPLNPGKQTFNVYRYLDFYRYVPPEIHLVLAKSPKGRNHFAEHWSERGKFFFYNWYIG